MDITIQWSRLLLHNKSLVTEGCFKCGYSRSEANKAEKFIKEQNSGKLIETMIAGKPLHGIMAQLVIVTHQDEQRINKRLPHLRDRRESK